MTTTPRTRILTTLGTLAVAALALSGCSSDAAPETGSSASATTAGAPAELSDAVAALLKPRDSYPIPTETIADVSAMKGKTVYYIPITLQAPQFGVTQQTITDALGKVGAKVQACDGKGTPTDIAACITQATDAKAAAIVTDAIPYVLAANALDAAQAAGIPVIISNQIPDEGHPASKTLHYIEDAGTPMQEAISQWIALDALENHDGKASVLINQSMDGPSPAAFVAAGNKLMEKYCPDCAVTINGISSSNFSLIPTSTSSALLKDPNVGFVVTQYEQFLQPTQTGVQQSGRLADIKGVAGAAQLASLTAIKDENFLYAAASQAAAFQGYVDADAAIRLTLGIDVPEYEIPVRLFTRDTIADVTITDAAQRSGEWFGPTDFPEKFATLWNVG